jgi:hypothetical protein
MVTGEVIVYELKVNDGGTYRSPTESESFYLEIIERLIQNEFFLLSKIKNPDDMRED